MKLSNLLLTSILSVAGILNISAAPTMVNARLDSATMLMGTLNTLHLEVVQDKSVKGEFALFRNFSERGYVTILNDTIELRQDVKIDTTEVGSGRIQINYAVPVQVFDSGAYKLPPFEFVAGRDTARSNSLILTVTPVKVKADDNISPMTDVAEPENSSIFDKVPDWLYNWWWVILLILLLIGAGVCGWRRYKKEGTILKPKPKTPPHILALERLERLKKRNLWQTGQEKEFYTLLTDILRSYLDARFGIKAMEMTSRQIMEKLAEDPAMRENRSRMRQILDMADFVKFAMVRPLPDDNIKAFDNAVAFVESTKPVETLESGEDTDAGKTDNKNKENIEPAVKKQNIRDKHLLKVAAKKKKRGGES
ncbi:MAG: cell wall anchor protein [Muribaculaceae bacterium]|nr:cell wall anchor protein [Muribaculaceae bacterium]